MIHVVFDLDYPSLHAKGLKFLLPILNPGLFYFFLFLERAVLKLPTLGRWMGWWVLFFISFPPNGGLTSLFKSQGEDDGKTTFFFSL